METPQVIEKVCNGCQYYMCSKCIFISLDKNILTAHVNEKFDSIMCQNNRKKITCFGCSNNFYTKDSLLSHIVNDHQMSETDAKILIEKLLASNNEQIKENNNKKICGIKITSDVKIIPSKILLIKEQKKIDKPLELFSSNIDDNKILINEKNKLTTTTNINNKILKKSIDSKQQHFKCSIDNCTVRLLSNENMEYHKTCHNDKKIDNNDNFKCPECEQYKTKDWRNIASHLWRQHIIDMELYACDLCNYKTPSLSKLINQHRGIHSDDRPFICEYCGKGFKTNKQLRTHKIFHKNNNSNVTYQCNNCQRIFKNLRLLKLHNNTVHNEYKPFKCHYCDYSASTRSVLKLHLRRHTGEKPFSCDQCSYSTGDHNSLRRHKLRHLKLKPYNCHLCNYACIQSSTYKVHLKNKHPGMNHELLFSCKYCSYKSLNNGNLLTHISTKHENKETENTQINTN
ncbi:hypothetical protein HCN44_001201 [Aphidius gifuensis]|uniref:C2H2-type domain-containing protein n=1 Tax=Aphidius gifuensis TaxID=684658 RepID=A0A834XLS0_APHGI|nr:zinc finger protein 681-like [Aphidius gifuensis]KAF7988628.1 hypothetical protein HCN44_001201 [Aphidius gifuensis]